MKLASPQKKEGFLGVVQFIHDGPEHKVDKTGWTSWNLKRHRRKYMLVDGQSINSQDEKHSSNLFFWGEWEGPSHAVYSWENGNKNLPSNLVVPRFPGFSKPVENLQNTDPYVFGDEFKYTLCKQANKTGSLTYLARLLPGTLVLFGSHILKKFVLDTAMIIGESIIPHTSQNWSTVLASCTDQYRAMTLQPMYWDKHIKSETTFKFYKGATHQSQFNETFSFAPCIRETDLPQRFSRPNIVISEVITQTLQQGGKKTPMSLASIKDCWSQVKSQVLEQHLLLGVKFTEPQLTVVPEDVWKH